MDIKRGRGRPRKTPYENGIAEKNNDLTRMVVYIDNGKPMVKVNSHVAIEVIVVGGSMVDRADIAYNCSKDVDEVYKLAQEIEIKIDRLKRR